MRVVVAVAIFCSSVLFNPLFAKEAVFANNVLKFDTVQVGTEVYSTELTPVPNVTPLTFTLTKATKVAATTAVAATFSGTTLTVPNVLINGTLRVSARLMLVGQNPYKFQVSTYSTLRGVELDTRGQTLVPGSIFGIKYTGGALAADKIKLTMGTTSLMPSVLDNTIAVSVPAGISGAQTLTVELDGDSFQLPLTVAAGVDIANPKPYITGYVNEVATDLRNLGLPAGLLDVTTITTQLASLSEADAKIAALQIRENLEPLLAQVNELVSSGIALSANAYALTLTSDADCDRWMKRFAAASITAGAGVWVTVGGASTGPAAAIIGSIGAASTVLATDVAIRNMKQIVNYCGALNDATFTQALLQSDLVLTKPIELYESRARTFKLNELFQLGQGIRSTYTATATGLKSTLTSAIAIATKLGFSSSSMLVSKLSSLAAEIKTDAGSTVSTDGHKYSIRAISDANISGSTINSGTGLLTLLLDKKNEDLAEGKSVSFTIELYNATDGISITVPVKLNGASLLEDLKEAVLGRWTVTAYEGATVLDLDFRAGGKGAYLFPLTAQDSTTGEGGYCKIYGTAPGKSGTQVGKNCEYPLTWSIAKVGSNYEFSEEGLWIHDGCCVITRQALSLPLSRIVIYGNGTPLRTYVRK